ncbi:hypothetical protein VP01_414g3 [Puccinia sorghi]|uniref:Tet-like 2OG-Fe(II) oxygenase domain-containing protein n=1 Tax=Puccinia sorghi TaxID=27349 RepID=A0A0L6UR01_9BASI|nr:hypothetical protein VP01_414g3 [Puccinia sorghi]
MVPGVISPSIPLDDKIKLTHQPTAPEVQSAIYTVYIGFFLLHSGQCVLLIPMTTSPSLLIISTWIFFPPGSMATRSLSDLSPLRFFHGLAIYCCSINQSLVINLKKWLLSLSKTTKLLWKKLISCLFIAFDLVKKPSPTTCSPHLTFTTDVFFPYVDTSDISYFAFVLFIPTFYSTGSLAPPNLGYDGGSISWDCQKMIWQENKYKNFTLPSSSMSRRGL